MDGRNVRTEDERRIEEQEEEVRKFLSGYDSLERDDCRIKSRRKTDEFLFGVIIMNCDYTLILD